MKRSFTIIELVIVMVLIAVIAAVAASTRNSPSQNRSAAASHKIKSDIRYAQGYALSTQDRTRVSFDTGAESYSVYAESGGGWSPINEPATNDSFTVDFTTRSEYAGVTIDSCDFDGSGRGLVFDAGGVPYSYSPSTGATSILTSEGTITLSDGITISVEPNTGAVSI